MVVGSVRWQLFYIHIGAGDQPTNITPLVFASVFNAHQNLWGVESLRECQLTWTDLAPSISPLCSGDNKAPPGAPSFVFCSKAIIDQFWKLSSGGAVPG